jgi:hypothetical protein
MKRQILVSIATFTAALIVSQSNAMAAFGLVENFDNLTTGPLNGQNGWTANALTTVVVESGSDKAASAANSGNAANYKSLGTQAIPDASTAATFFFTLTLSVATGNNFNFILTDVAAPTDTSSTSEVQLNTDGSAPAGFTGGSAFRARSGPNFVFLSTAAGDVTKTVPQVASTPYSIWMVVNNSTDTYQIYMQNAAVPSIAAGPTQLFNSASGGTGVFTFRNTVRR